MKRAATLKRYLGREIYKATAFVLIAFLGLFAFFDLINELRDVGKGGYKLQHAFLFVLLSIPGHVYELFPIAVLIGTLYALSHLAANSEFTVMRTAGFSPYQAGATLVRIGMVFVVLTILVGELATPAAERAAQQLRLAALESVVGQEFRSGLWVRADSRFVNVKEVRPDSTLVGILMYEFDAAYKLQSISEAREGRYVGERRWKLADVVETRFGPQGTKVVRIPERDWESVLTPEVLSVLLVDPQKMSAWNLLEYTRHLAENKQRTERYEIALWKKVVYPFAALVMMALALPFGYIHVRQGGVGVKVFSGIMLGVVFHALNSLFSHLGVLQSWPPLASALLPSAIFLAAAVGMMYAVERR
jgi:lipopolysaccharide export system permease protein